jgi:hypothetical protein
VFVLRFAFLAFRLLARKQRCSALRPTWSTVAGEEELVYIYRERGDVANGQW